MLNVLLTRPEKKSQQLTLLLNQQGITCVNQPLFDYQALADINTSKALLSAKNILIFVSVAAVDYAHASYPTHDWQYDEIIAVGSATQKALQKLGVSNVITPHQENSEGLLALPELINHIAGKTITIIRGNGGREHLAKTLTKRGSEVSYLESYQRVWRILAKDISNQWYLQKINCIVVTSNAILEKLVQLTIGQQNQNESLPLTNYWAEQCLWVVVSQRIADRAKQLGLLRVTICTGASEQVLCKLLSSLKT